MAAILPARQAVAAAANVEWVDGFPSKDVGDVGACFLEESMACGGMDGEQHRGLEGQQRCRVQGRPQCAELARPVFRPHRVSQVLRRDDGVPHEVVGLALVLFGVPGDDGRRFCQIIPGDRGDAALPEWCRDDTFAGGQELADQFRVETVPQNRPLRRSAAEAAFCPAVGQRES
ncbi:hypothetical protein [Arthrobacter pascens]|uniref:hypothetical protein n=1 Tax=Arthrobacter pascens TaxID=1677 RepID=UPI00196A62DB|nr:hypothetical protein [Arthrobacter pascens]MBN3497710.1 hypothetical protein [Arthrobacter pascens]